MAPPGTRVIIHEKPGNRASWAPHGSKGWYVGPAPHHYRCWTVYVDKTRSERVGDTVEFFPHQCPMPKLSSADLATKAAIELLNALHNPMPAAPFAPLNATTMEGITRISEIFHQAVQDKLTRPVPAPTPNPTVRHSNRLDSHPPPRVPTRVTPTLPHIQAPPPRVPSPHQPQQGHPPTRVQPPRVETATGSALPHLHPPQARSTFPHLHPPNHRYPTSTRNNFVHAVIDPITGQNQEYRQLIRSPHTKELWERSAANEFGRLMQGLKRGNIQGTETMRFIKRSEMPQGRQATYAKYVCEYKPNKQEKERTRITVGGDCIDYPGEVATKSADITTIKCLLNSVISTKNGRFATADVKNFYLNTPMARPEYMKIKVEFIPQEIQDEYDIADKIIDGYVYVEINKGMYGLPQAGILANRLLVKRLDSYGFRPNTAHTWIMATRKSPHPVCTGCGRLRNPVHRQNRCRLLTSHTSQTLQKHYSRMGRKEILQCQHYL